MEIIVTFSQVFFLSCLSSASGIGELPESHQVVMNLLKSETYFNNLIPQEIQNGSSAEASKPLNVFVNLGFREVESIDDRKMEMKVKLSLRQKWRDFRLQYDSGNKSGYVTLHSDFPYKPWIPDTLMGKEKGSRIHSVLPRQNFLLRISPDGTVLTSVHVSSTISCLMRFERFPFDQQTCVIRVGTWAYQNSSLDMLWDPCCKPTQKVKLGSQHLPQFSLKEVHHGRCVQDTVTGYYTSVFVALKFQRQLGYYLTQFFMPTILFTSLTWISFWLGSAMEARLALTVTVLLTLTSQFSGIFQNLPQVSYVTAITLFSGVALLYATLSIFESAVVFSMMVKEKDAEKKKRMVDEERKEGEANEAEVALVSNPAQKSATGVPPTKQDESSSKRWRRLIQRIDTGSKFLFPVSYVLFCGAFFGVHLAEYELFGNGNGSSGDNDHDITYESGLNGKNEMIHCDELSKL